MSPASEEIAREFAEKVRARVPGQTREIYLYGSRARGDEEPDSDYDVLIVVDDMVPGLEDEVFEAGGEILDAHGALVAPTVCQRDVFERFKEVGLFRAVLREGIRL